MNRHNDIGVIMEARQQTNSTKSHYQYLIARRGLKIRLTPQDKRDLLRLRAFQLVGREDDKAR
jgi:hypothetical protein